MKASPFNQFLCAFIAIFNSPIACRLWHFHGCVFYPKIIVFSNVKKMKFIEI